MRLNKYLALCGLDSRRGCEELITAGRVRINGVVVDKLSAQVMPDDKVLLDGKVIQPQPLVYVLLNKPRGYITTRHDEFQRQTVAQLVPLPVKLNPVGRLDADSSGVLLLTNDGELHYRLTHPRFGVIRHYRVTIAGKLSPGEMQQLQKGIEILPGKVARPTLKRIKSRDDHTVLHLELGEGLNREIRRIFTALGKKVLALDRLAYGGIRCRELRRGAWRYLTSAEISRLKKLVGLE